MLFPLPSRCLLLSSCVPLRFGQLYLVNATTGAVIGKPVTVYVHPTANSSLFLSQLYSAVVLDSAVIAGARLRLMLVSTNVGGVSSNATSPPFAVDTTPATGATPVLTASPSSLVHVPYWSVNTTGAFVCWPGLAEDAYSGIAAVSVTVFATATASVVRMSAAATVTSANPVAPLCVALPAFAPALPLHAALRAQVAVTNTAGLPSLLLSPTFDVDDSVPALVCSGAGCVFPAAAHYPMLMELQVRSSGVRVVADCRWRIGCPSCLTILCTTVDVSSLIALFQCFIVAPWHD